MPEQKKKSWFRRHWLLTIIIVLVLIFIIIGRSNSGTKDTNNKDNNTTQQKPEYFCPDLSSMKLKGYDPLMQTYTAQVSPYKSGNLEIVYDYNSQVEENENIIYCDAGHDEGQNANWVYCGDFIRPIIAQYTDSSGSIVKKRGVEVTFDKNTKQYLSTTCDTYDLM